MRSEEDSQFCSTGHSRLCKQRGKPPSILFTKHRIKEYKVKEKNKCLKYGTNFLTWGKNR